MSSRLLKKLEKVFAAVAFAEAGEHEYARRIMGYASPPREASILDRISKLAMAVTFAEANCHETALDMLGGNKPVKNKAVPSFAKVVGLEGIRIRYGVVEVS